MWHIDPSNHLATVYQHYRQDRTDRQWSDSIGRTVLQTVAQNCYLAVDYALMWVLHSKTNYYDRICNIQMNSYVAQHCGSYASWRNLSCWSHWCLQYEPVSNIGTHTLDGMPSSLFTLSTGLLLCISTFKCWPRVDPGAVSTGLSK